MANAIPPLVSNTPPPIDFNENHENEDDFGGFESSDVTFNNNFIDDTPSLPSTPGDVSKTSESISEIDLPVATFDDDIFVAIVPIKNSNQSEINSQDLDSSNIVVDKIEDTCEKSLENDNYFNDDNNIDNKPNLLTCKKIEVNAVDSQNVCKHPNFENYNEYDHDNEDDFDFKLNEGPPSLMLSNNDLEDGDDEFSSVFETNNNSSSNINQLDKTNSKNSKQITQFEDDCSVLSLKLDSVRISTNNSPILHESKLNCDEINVNDNLDVEIDFETFEDNEKLHNDSVYDKSVFNKFQYLDEIVYSNKIPFSNEFESNFETHFEANFNDTELASCNKDIPAQVLETKSHLNDIDEDDFDDFKDFKIPCVEHLADNNHEKDNKVEESSIKANNNYSDDDDEFGDFSDFTQAQQISDTIVLQKPILEIQQIKSVLDYMFPIQEKYKETVQINITNYVQIEKNTSLVNLLQFDSTIALNYQWNNSNSNQVLVKSLGIDSRNILFGSKWSIPVPRFAANLGISPLEPLKPTTITTPDSFDITNNRQQLNKIQSTTGTDVPAVQFDWNSAGLVNPLDGQKEVHETSSSESQPTRTEINSITHFDSSLSPISTVPTDTILSSSKIDPPIEASPITPPSEDYSSIETDLEVHLKHNVEHVGAINSYVAPSTGNLRETHIFTPSKGINPISRDVSCINSLTFESTNIDKDLEELSTEIKINKNVITKEYRDVEYDFPEVNNILQPVKVNNNINNNSNSIIIINWPDPGDFSSSISLESGITSKRNSGEFEFSEFQGTNTIKYDPRDDDIEYDAELNKQQNFKNINKNTTCPVLSSPIHTSHAANIDEFLRPTIGLSPTEELKTSITNNDLDDEFTEFQYASPLPLSIISSASNSAPMANTISMTKEIHNTVFSNYNNCYEPSFSQTIPSSNLFAVSNQTNKQSINLVWPDPSGVDSVEIARIEAAFSYNKVESEKISQPSGGKVTEHINNCFTKTPNKDDDEWSDFVSSNTVADVVNLVKSDSKLETNNDEDWSDFVSVKPAVTNISNNYKTLSSHNDNSRPNFSSWNSPIQYDSFVQSTSSSWVSEPPQLSHGVQNYYKTHNNGVILNPLLSHNHQMSTGISILNSSKPNVHGKSNLNINNNIINNNNNTKLQQQPNVSLIPDLSFIAPKNLINVPRTNFNSKK